MKNRKSTIKRLCPICCLATYWSKKGEKGKYYKVATPDGREGFVLKKHAAALEEWANQTYDFKTIEKNARKMMGRPYLWGGMSAKMG